MTTDDAQKETILKFKWQQLFDEYNAKPCPPHKNRLDIAECARWSLDPYNNELNMLPNFQYNRLKAKPKRMNAAEDVTVNCYNCSLSFYKSFDLCMSVVDSLEKRIWNLLGYTHVGIGYITKDDGFVSDFESDGHFMLWEFEGVDLIPRFSNLIPVNKI